MSDIIPYIPNSDYSLVLEGGNAIELQPDQQEKILSALLQSNPPSFIKIGNNLYARRLILGVLDREATENVIYSRSNYRKCGGCGQWLPPKKECGYCA